MEKTEKKRNIALAVIIILLIINFFGMVELFSKINNNEKNENDVQYVMYVGTNDKDTYKQIISTEDAKKIINNICLDYLEGYTIQEASGMWKDEKGIPTEENTIVCYFDNAKEEAVYKIADEIIEDLNQNSVLIEKNLISTELYYGVPGSVKGDGSK